MAVGRKTVAPRQTITSQWGNWVWDQSVQAFADKAARQTQFPNPQLGACCTLDDHPNQLYQWNGTAWITRQFGVANVSTDANATFVWTFPKPFAAVPSSIILQGQATATFSVIPTPFAGQVTATSLNGVARTLGGTGSAPSTTVQFWYALTGAD